MQEVTGTATQKLVSMKTILIYRNVFQDIETN